MASLYHLTAVVFLVCCLTTTFAEGNSTFQSRNNTFNGTSTSAVCKLHISKSEIEEVLRLQYNSTTNTVKIKVSVVSENGTRYFPEMTWLWASEIGRTIISLVRLAKDTIFTSPIFTSILEIGTEEVDIQVTEETDGCLPPGEEGSDRIFDFLLHHFSHSKDTPVYKLCRVHQDESLYATYNCCRITGDRNLVVCADYSSVVVKFALPAVIVVFSISFFLVLPFVLEHIITYPTIKFHRTSDSHMSLISIASMIFFEGRKPAMSLLRRSLFAGLSSTVFLRDFFGILWLKVLFGVWAAVFVISYDVQMTHEECEKECARPKWDENIISCFTIPFNLPFYYSWTKYKCCRNSCSGGSCCQNAFCKYLKDWFYNICICILTILYFIICVPFLVVVCLVKFTIWDLFKSFIWPSCPAETWKKCLLCFVRLPTLVISVFVTGMFLIFALFIVVGFSLNAEYFNPFVAPIFTLIVYFWKNWKFSVEAKCLQLKTSIIEVCKEKAPPREDEKISENRSTNINAKNKNVLTCKDRVFDFLCPCVRDTSKDSHTWRSLKNLCRCCTKSTLQEEMEVENFLPNTSSDKSSNKEHGSSAIKDNENTKNDGYMGHEQTSTSIKYHENENEKRKGEVTETNTDTNEPSTSGNGDNAELANIIESGKEDAKLIIKFDKHGEAMISKELYEKVSNEILPLQHLLFYFFRRVIFVGLYAFVMFTVMTLGRESGVSDSVQVISAIAGALIPFVFDTIFADRHLSQKMSKIMATKERLEHILKVKKRENNTIFVELINVNDDESLKDQQVQRRQCGISDDYC
jgi:hypothetical protein